MPLLRQPFFFVSLKEAHSFSFYVEWKNALIRISVFVEFVWLNDQIVGFYVCKLDYAVLWTFIWTPWINPTKQYVVIRRYITLNFMRKMTAIIQKINTYWLPLGISKSHLFCFLFLFKFSLFPLALVCLYQTLSSSLALFPSCSYSICAISRFFSSFHSHSASIVIPTSKLLFLLYHFIAIMSAANSFTIFISLSHTLGIVSSLKVQAQNWRRIRKIFIYIIATSR